jgi:hypothetical protein
MLVNNGLSIFKYVSAIEWTSMSLYKLFFNLAFNLLLLIFCCTVDEAWQLNNQIGIFVQQIVTLMGWHMLHHVTAM